MQTPQATKGPKTAELRLFRYLFLGTLVLALAVAGLSQWRVFRRPLLASSPVGLTLSFQKTAYFDQIESLDQDPSFYLSRVIGDSFTTPVRASGDIWGASGNPDSLVLLFRNSFAVYKPKRDPSELELAFAGKLAFAWPPVALVQLESAAVGIGYRRHPDGRGGELRAFDFSDLEARERPDRLDLGGPLTSVSAGRVAHQALVVATFLNDEGKPQTVWSRIGASGPFSEPQFFETPLSLHTSFSWGEPKEGVLPEESPRPDKSTQPEGDTLYVLGFEKDDRPEAFVLWRWAGEGFERIGPVPGETKDWLAAQEVRDLAAARQGDSILVALTGDDFHFNVFTPAGGFRGPFRPLPFKKLTGGSPERSLWNYLLPLLLLLTLVGLFSKRGRADEDFARPGSREKLSREGSRSGEAEEEKDSGGGETREPKGPSEDTRRGPERAEADAAASPVKKEEAS